MELPQSLQPPSSSSSSFSFSSSSLPPGCRFFPSDEQLLRFYLSNKASGHNDSNLIKDLNPFDYDPFDLPDSACFSYGSKARKKHWYYYALTAFRENGGWIRMKTGYWRRKGKVKEVTGRRGLVLGIKRTFVFYLGNSINKSLKTNWIMYEYALDHRFKVLLLPISFQSIGNRVNLFWRYVFLSPFHRSLIVERPWFVQNVLSSNGSISLFDGQISRIWYGYCDRLFH